MLTPKQQSSQLRRGFQSVLLLGLFLGTNASPFADIDSSVVDFAEWHLPLPAGDWVISRGPCSSQTQSSHPCADYEQRCALDLIPTEGSMENLPVLAPQAGQVFSVSRRASGNITIMLQHADGRVSVFMHLARTIVAPEQWISQGEVIGYAGHTGVTSAHLHFFIQPNLVQRTCLMPDGLDEIDYANMRAVSHNLAWEQVILINPPDATLARLPPIVISKPNSTVRLQIVPTPQAHFRLPVLLTGTLSYTKRMGVVLSGRDIWWSSLITRTVEGALFSVPIQAPRNPGPGTWTPATGEALAEHVFTLVFTVTQPALLIPAHGVILTNPELVSPTSYSRFRHSPDLCWRMPVGDGMPPFEFRVIVAGPTAVDSGWLTDLSTKACWQAPELPKGIYFWKVFTRDVRGYTNRTQQYPLAFVIR